MFFTKEDQMRSRIAAIFIICTPIWFSFGWLPVQAQETIKIGYVTPLSGPGSLFGLTAQQAFTLGLEDANAKWGARGKKIEPITYDSQGKPTVAATLAQRLMLEHKVPIICMGSGSLDALATMEVTERAKKPFFVCASSSPIITEKGCKWVWRESVNDRFLAELLGKYIKAKSDWNRIAILHENSDYGRPPAEILTAIIKESKGKQTVAVESFNRGDTNISGQLSAIKRVNPDVLVTWGYHTEHALIARYRQQIGLQAQVIGNATMGFPEFIQLGGAAAEGIMLIGPLSCPNINLDPNVLSFAKRYEERFHRQYGVTSIDNYNGAMIVSEVLNKVGTDSEKIRNALNTMTFQGIDAPSKFDTNGQRMASALIIAKIEGGKHKYLETFKVD
jgi:branched-chain amino acid transport system substrate-binding protein